jgi:hypothetical protein
MAFRFILKTLEFSIVKISNKKHIIGGGFFALPSGVRTKARIDEYTILLDL